jgi:glycosyltransferase involved in cell wall biosynthesis
MKILHLITTIDMGGAEKQLLVLVREQVASGMEVIVLPLKGSNELLEEFSSAGATVLSDLYMQPLFTQLFKLRCLTRLNEYVIHAHLPRAELIASLVRRKKRVVVSRHNTETFLPNGPKPLSIVLSRWVYARSEAVVCISMAVKEFMVSNLEIPDTPKVYVVHYGYDQKFLIRKRNEKPHTPLIIGTIGRLVPQKDQRTIICAVDYLAQKGILVELRILGEGPLREDLGKLTIELNLEDQIQFINRTSDIRGFLESIDIFVLASKYEGFGLVLLEAMCAGVPVIAAKNSAISEVLGPDHKLYFQTSNFLALAERIEYLSSAEISEEIVDDQVINYQRFNPKKMSLAIRQTYS